MNYFNSDTETLTWCRNVFLKEDTTVDQQKADEILHELMNYQTHNPEY